MKRDLIQTVLNMAVEYGYKETFTKDKLDLLQIGIASDKTVLIAVLTSKEFTDSFASSLWEQNTYVGIDWNEHYWDITKEWSQFDTFPIFVEWYLTKLIFAIYNNELDKFFSRLVDDIVILDNFHNLVTRSKIV